MPINPVSKCISTNRRKIPVFLLVVAIGLTFTVVFTLGSFEKRVGFSEGNLLSSGQTLNVTAEVTEPRNWLAPILENLKNSFMKDSDGTKTNHTTPTATVRQKDLSRSCARRQPHPNPFLSDSSLNYRKLPTCMMPSLHQRRPTAEESLKKSKRYNSDSLPLLYKIFPFSTTFFRPPYYGQIDLTFNGSFAPQDFFVHYDESEWTEYCERITGQRLTENSDPSISEHKSKIGQIVVPDKIVFAFVQNRAEWEEETIIWQLTPSLFIMDRRRGGDGPGVTVPKNGQGSEEELQAEAKNMNISDMAPQKDHKSHPIIFSFHFAFDGEMNNPNEFVSDFVETISCLREHFRMWYDDATIDNLFSDIDAMGFLMVSDVVTNHVRIRRTLDVYESLRLGDWSLEQNEYSLTKSQIKRQNEEAFNFNAHSTLSSATPSQLRSVLSGTAFPQSNESFSSDISPKELWNKIYSFWKEKIIDIEIDKRQSNKIVVGPRSPHQTVGDSSQISRDTSSPRDGTKYYSFSQPDPNITTPSSYIPSFVLPQIKTIISVSDEGASASDTARLLNEWRRAKPDERSFLRQYSTHRVASLSASDKEGIEHVMLGFRHFRKGILTEGRVVGDSSYGIPYLGGLAPTERFVIAFRNSASSLRPKENSPPVPPRLNMTTQGPPERRAEGRLDHLTDHRKSQEHIPSTGEDQYPKIIASLQKELLWSFMGGMKSDREEMIRLFRDLSAVTNTKHECCSGDKIEPLYKKSLFVPIGRGHVTLDCFRIYETAGAGSLPVIVGSSKELLETFGGFASGGEYGSPIDELDGGGYGGSSEDVSFLKKLPPYVFATSWDSASRMAKELLSKPHLYRERQILLTRWFMNMYWFMQERMVFGREGGMRKRYLQNHH